MAEDLRLVFTRTPGAWNALDGGWWPRTRTLSQELPALLAAVADGFGVVGPELLKLTRSAK